MNATQILHILSICLGALAAIFAYLDDMTYAGIVGIVIVAVNSVGAYVGGDSSSTPGS